MASTQSAAKSGALAPRLPRPFCKESERLEKEVANQRNRLVKLQQRCSEVTYKDTEEWFVENTIDDKPTLLTLVNYLKHRVRTNPELTFSEFLEKFPPVGAGKFEKSPSRNHVFEMMLRFLLILGYDSNWLFSREHDKRIVVAPSGGNYVCGNAKVLQGGVNVLDERINLGSEASQGGLSGVDIELQWPGSDHTDNSLSICHPGNENRKHRLIIQCKYFGKESGDASRYGLGEMVRQIDVAGFDKHNTDYALFVNNAEDLDAAIQRKQDKAYFKVSKDKSAFIVGTSLHNSWFRHLTNMLREAGDEDINKVLCGKSYMNTPTLSLRFHQEYFVKASEKLIHEGTRRLVWGAVPRSGKTFIVAAMIARRLEQKKDALILLGAKGDTYKQFEAPLRAAIPNLRGDIGKEGGNYFEFITNGRTITVMGYGLFAGTDETKDVRKRTNAQIVNDLLKKGTHGVDVYYDEMHIGGERIASDGKLDRLLQQKNAIFVGVTATYTSLLGFADKNKKRIFNENSLITWEYGDQQSMKFCATGTVARNEIIQRRTGVLRTIIHDMFNTRTEDELDALQREYSSSPTLITWNTHDEEYKVSGVQSTDWAKTVVRKLEQDLTQLPRLAEDGCPLAADCAVNTNGPYGFLYTMGYDVRRRNNDRRHIQLWFVPYGGREEYSANFKAYADAVKKAVLSTRLAKHFNIITMSEDDTSAGKAKDYVNRKFAEANRVDKSLIVLTAQKLQVGVSLACADVVMNFNDESGIDSQYQTMFRPLTESVGKDFGYYLDMNPHRFIGFSVNLLRQRKELTSGSQEGQRAAVVRFLQEWRYNGVGPGGFATALTGEELDRELRSITTLVTTEVARIERNTKIDEALKKDRVLLEKLLKAHSQLNVGNVEAKKLERGTIREADLELVGTAEDEGAPAPDARVPKSKQPEKEQIKELTPEQLSEFYHDVTALLAITCDDVDLLGCATSAFKDIETHTNVYEDPCICNPVVEFEALACYMKNVYDMTTYKPVPSKLFEVIKYIGDKKASELAAKGYRTIEDLKKAVRDDPRLFTRKQAESVEQIKEDEIPKKNISEVVASVKNMKHHLGVYIDTLRGTTLGEKEVAEVLQNIYDNIREKMGISSRSGDDPQIYRMWKEGGGGESSSKDIPAKVQTLLEKYLKIREAEKDKFGEVFTPPSLIECMLDKLGEYDKDAWTNPKGTFLDPAAGICNFAMVAYVKLMKGLSKAIPDDHKRSEHIIKNMLFNVELNPKNVTIARRVFGRNANIACGNSLEGAWVEGPNGPAWKAGSEKKPVTEGMMKFGVVMGNPPYNKSKEGSGGKSSGSPIWQKFVERAMDAQINKSGFLLFIHPRGWREVSSPLQDLLIRNNFMRYLEMHDGPSASKIFEGTSLPGIDWYIVERTAMRANTDVCDSEGVADSVPLHDMSYIPSARLALVDQVLSNSREISLAVFPRSYQFGSNVPKGKALSDVRPWMSKVRNDAHPYIIIGTTPAGIPRTITTNDEAMRYKSKLKLLYSSTKSPHLPRSETIDMFVPKVVLSDGTQQGAFYDSAGIFGLTEHCFGIKETNADTAMKIVDVLRSPQFMRFIKYLTTGGSYGITFKILSSLRKDFYKAFLPGGEIHKLYEEGKLKPPAERQCGYVPPNPKRGQPASCNGTRRVSKEGAAAESKREGKGRSTRRHSKSSNANRTRRRQRKAIKSRTRRASRRQR